MRATIQPIEDLRWLIQDSDSELGQCAQAIHPTSHIMSANHDFGWGEREFAAARRKKLILSALRSLSPRHLCVIELAYEPRAQFTAVGEQDHEAMSPEDRARFSLAAPVVRKVRAEYAQQSVDADRELRRRLRDEKYAREGDNVDELVAAKAELSAARHEVRRIKEAAAASEREGVQLLRDAHRAYVAARKLVNAKRRGDRRARKEALRERVRARKTEARATARSLSDSHDDEVKEIVAMFRGLGLGRARFTDRAAEWLTPPKDRS